jgi:23S rRNA-/tRNA-specific pseudouridylate synthase
LLKEYEPSFIVEYIFFKFGYSLKKTAMVKVLTVGDGDLSLSLALARAYGEHIELTASVLDSKEDLVRAYPDASNAVDELQSQSLNVAVLNGVDATQLHEQKFPGCKNNSWDLILFHHPHLGLASLNKDEGHHANRHFRLLCHYLHSASQVSNLVHICLCGTQPETWRLQEAANMQGLELVKSLSTAAPFPQIWTTNDVEAAPAQSQYSAPRRYRNGKLGSRHFLGKYGYRHRRTEGERYKGMSSDMNVAGSMHFVFQKQASSSSSSPPTTTTTTTTTTVDLLLLPPHSCTVCRATFDCENTLRDHFLAPAKPEVDHTTAAAAATAATVTATTTSKQKQAATDGFVHKTPPKNNVIHQPSSTPSSIDPTTTRTTMNTKENHLAAASCSTTSQTTVSNNLSNNDTQKQQVKEELVVDADGVGKRLRWFIQHNTHQGLSKRQAESSITQGVVLVNGTPALDSSRILTMGDIIQVMLEQQQPAKLLSLSSTSNIVVSSSSTTLEVLYRQSPLLVVWKPAGMRNKGMFPGTLEAALLEQEGVAYTSLSRLDTACPGLCVVTTQDERIATSLPSIRHSLTALVHGRVPEEWSSSSPQKEVSIPMQAKWKKKRKHSGDAAAAVVEHHETVQLIPMERTTTTAATDDNNNNNNNNKSNNTSKEIDNASLSTLCMVVTGTMASSASSLCRFLRQEGFPVVGDQYCRQEYLKLKRSIRNRIKNKLCIGCYQVEVNGVTVVQKAIPDKLSATFWEQHYLNGGGGPQQNNHDNEEEHNTQTQPRNSDTTS